MAFGGPWDAFRHVLGRLLRILEAYLGIPWGLFWMDWKRLRRRRFFCSLGNGFRRLSEDFLARSWATLGDFGGSFRDCLGIVLVG